ncbi:MAG: hypothetical protein PHC88_02210 [Terrimicrobiaceae bacterium]|nr:hypothetical protein [Terrimicrobiaceae bacterium]
MARRKRSNEKLRAALAPDLRATVPTRWVKFVVGLFLLPPAWVLTETFFTAFARAALHEHFWATEEFWFFGLGLVLWLVAFLALPRPLWIYVFGHELTHALWVLLHGGRVSQFRITPQGGHILSDRINTWIALAPYFFPIYSLLVIAIYGAAGLFWDMTPFRPVLYMLIGATWGFHITFTLWMIPRGQTDITYGGNFYSLVIIYLLNLAVLSIFLIAASQGLTLAGFGRELLANSVDFVARATHLLRLGRL